jgi:hypothetical protein
VPRKPVERPPGGLCTYEATLVRHEGGSLGLGVSCTPVWLAQAKGEPAFVNVTEITRFSRVTPTEPSPAEQAGVAIGDIVIGINNVSTVGLGTKEVADMISRAGDAPLHLVLLRPTPLMRLRVSAPRPRRQRHTGTAPLHVPRCGFCLCPPRSSTVRRMPALETGHTLRFHRTCRRAPPPPPADPPPPTTTIRPQGVVNTPPATGDGAGGGGGPVRGAFSVLLNDGVGYTHMWKGL